VAELKTRVLGKSGVPVSEVGLGCWQLGGDFGPVGDDRAQAILRAANEQAISFWDTADVYGSGQSERRIAAFLQGSGTKPFVTTKVGRSPAIYPDGYTKQNVRKSLEGSAARLNVDCIDLVQLHCVPLDILKAGDIIGWMEDLQTEGLIRFFGASVETIEEARVAAKSPKLVSLQIIFNIFRQNAIDELFPLAEANNVGIIVRLPLASGVLGGKMTHGQKFAESDHRHYNRHGEAFSVGETFSGIPFDTALNLVEDLKPLVPNGMTMAQMAMRWILDYPAVTTVIAGASRPEQVLENASVSSLRPLPEALHRKLAQIYRRDVEPALLVTV
jgi:aryl-alcohol dehydrogenase-like predicted oxidoreductase